MDKNNFEQERLLAMAALFSLLLLAQLFFFFRLRKVVIGLALVAWLVGWGLFGFHAHDILKINW